MYVWIVRAEMGSGSYSAQDKEGYELPVAAWGPLRAQSFVWALFCVPLKKGVLLHPRILKEFG